MATITSHNPAETFAHGGAIAATLRVGDVLALDGDLGAGKTHLVKGIAAGLGCTGDVTSPTFTVAQRYAGSVPVAHLDAYRLGDADDEEAELIRDAVADAVAFVEWPDAVIDVLPPPRLEVELRHGGGDRRLVLLAPRQEESAGSPLGRLLADLRPRHINGEPEPGASADAARSARALVARFTRFTLLGGLQRPCGGGLWRGERSLRPRARAAGQDPLQALGDRERRMPGRQGQRPVRQARRMRQGVIWDFGFGIWDFGLR